MKYFEENMSDGQSLDDLHYAVVQSSGTVLTNLFFHQVEDDADTPKHREALARSCYGLISVLEAIIARVPEDEARKAYEDTKERVKPFDDDFGKALEVVLDRIFG